VKEGEELDPDVEVVVWNVPFNSGISSDLT
jgi:hypothetical protein